jgi:polyhydroxybutyrate depolymerase
MTLGAPRSRVAWLAAACFGCGVAAFVLASCAPAIPDATEPTLLFGSLVWNSLERTFAVYAPADPAVPAPLVFVLHGGSGSANSVWNSETGHAWKTLADEHGFLLALPEGRADPDAPDQHHWNDCRSDINNADAISTEDDVGYIDLLIDRIAARVSVDSSRIYVTGASNGGMMTFRLAMQLGDRLAAAGAIIANLPDPSECPFEAVPLPILIMNGTADPVIPYGGGCVAGATCDRGRVRSTDETVAFWVDVNGAGTSAEEVALPDRVSADGSTVTVFTHRGGATGEDVILYRIDGGGHSIPGPEPTAASLRAAVRKNQDIDAAVEIWRFFEQHARSS